VMAQSLFKVLDQQGDVSVDVLAPPITFPLLARMPEVSTAIKSKQFHGRLNLLARHGLAKQLRGKYQQAIVVPSSIKSALIPWMAKIPKRTGYRGEHRYGLINDMRRLDKQAMPYCVQRFVAHGDDPADRVGVPVPSLSEIDPPHLRVDCVNQTRVIDRLGLDITRPILAVCPGAEYGPTKRWPADYFRRISEAKVAQGWQVWVFGAKKEASLANQIVGEKQPHIIDLAGATDLLDAIDLLALSRCVVSNDSGLMHIAAALALPQVALYGSSSAEFTPPLNQFCQILSVDIACRPCFQRECPLDHLNCMNQLTPDRVIETIDQLVAA
jgi:heptosyltransferase-2